MVMNKGMESNAKHVLNSVNLSNEEKNTNKDFNPSVLGREFVRQYYTMLNEGPQNLFRFYSDNSSLIRGNEPAMNVETVTPAFGLADINKKLMSLNFRDCHTKIRQVDSLETVNKSVVIQVIGELSNNGQPMRRFFQTFILAPRTPTHYYVRNDIFRYQDEVFVEDDEGYTEENVEDSNHLDNNLDSNENVLNSSLVVNKSEKMNGTFNENDKLNSDLDNFSCMNPEISPINPEEISGSEKSIESKNFKLNDKETGLTQSKDSLEDQKSSDLETENQLTSSIIVEKRQNQPKTYATMVQRTYGNLSSSVTPLNNNLDKKPVNKSSTAFPKPGEDTNLNTNNFESGKNKDKEDFLSNSENWQCENSNESSENIEGQDINIKRNNLSNNSQQHSDDQQVFVGNLPQNINETHLRQFFIEYGEIIDIRINRQNQKQGKTPNYGFITFSEASVVKKILSQKPIYFKDHRINVEEKRSHSGRNFNNNNQGNFVRNQNNNVCSLNNHLSNNRNFNNSSGSSNNQFAFNSRGLRDQERNNRGFNNDKRKTTLNSNNSGNRAQNNFNRR